MNKGDEQLASRQREILQAAQKVFDARGYAATTMDAVAAEAGISKGSIYNYCRNKHDLFVQVFSEVIAGQEAETRELVQQGMTATEKIQRLLEFWAERMSQYQQLGRLMLEFWATAAREESDGEMAAWFAEMYARWRSLVADIVRLGVASGEFRVDGDAKVVASMILGVMDGVLVHRILGMLPQSDERFVDALKQEILSGLIGDPTSTGQQTSDED